MLLKDIFVNLSIFSFLVSAAVVTRIFYFPIKPVKRSRLLGGCYAGVVALILMNISIPYEGNLLDIHYIPLILSLIYLGFGPGVVTSAMILLGNLLFSSHLTLDYSIFFTTVLLFLVSFSLLKKPYQKVLLLLIEYVLVVFIMHGFFGVPLSLSFMATLICFLFVCLTIGIWLMEGHNTLYSLMNRLSELNATLKESQQELKDTIRGQQGVIFKFKKVEGKFVVTLCDGQLIRKQQLNPEIFIFSDWTKLIPASLVEPLTLYFEKAWQGHEMNFEQEWPVGKIFLFMLQPILRDGQVIEVVGSVINVTEKKRVEMALEESEREYRLIAENTSDLITVLQVNGKMKYLSPSHQTILGLSPSELIGKDFLTIFDPQDLYRLKEKFARIIVDQRPDQIEFRFQRHDEKDPVQFESRCMPVAGINGDVEYIVIVSRDISERKKAEELVLVSEKLSVVGELAAGVAHEIRNPLTTLKGFVQMFKKGEMDPIYLDIISDELDRIELITNEFLVLAKPQVVHYRLDSISSILQNVITVLTPQMNMNNIQVHMHLDGELPGISCEQSQLKQVFINIMKNAIEAMPRGGNITIRTSKAGGFIRIEVVDEGCGIPPELISRLGEPFYTLKEKGTGLGLMVCKKIIKEHGGRIDYASELDRGTTVTIELPIAR